MNTISMILLVCGIDGVLHIKKWKIALHGVVSKLQKFSSKTQNKLTSSILGVFFLFSILEALINKNLAEVSIYFSIKPNI